MAKGGSVERRAADVVRLERHRIQGPLNSKTYVIEGDGGYYLVTILINVGRGLAKKLRGKVMGGTCTCKYGRDNIHPEGENPKTYIPVDEGCWHVRAAARMVGSPMVNEEV